MQKKVYNDDYRDFTVLKTDAVTGDVKRSPVSLETTHIRGSSKWKKLILLVAGYI